MTDGGGVSLERLTLAGWVADGPHSDMGLISLTEWPVLPQHAGSRHEAHFIGGNPLPMYVGAHHFSLIHLFISRFSLSIDWLFLSHSFLHLSFLAFH